MAHGGDKKALQELISGLGNQIVAGVKNPFAKLQQDQDERTALAMQVAKEIEIQNLKWLSANQ